MNTQQLLLKVVFLLLCFVLTVLANGGKSDDNDGGKKMMTLSSAFQADIVRVDITENYDRLRTNRTEDRNDSENVGSDQRLVNKEWFAKLYDAKEHLTRNEMNNEVLNYNMRISVPFYHKVAPVAAHFLPAGNEYEFSMKASFYDVEFSSDLKFHEDVIRKTYQFPFNDLILTENNGRKIVELDQRKSESDEDVPMREMEVVTRIDWKKLNDTVPVDVTVKLRLYHKQYSYYDVADVACSVAYESRLPLEARHVFSYKSMPDIEKYKPTTYRIRAYYLNVPYGDGNYRFRVAFRQQYCITIIIVDDDAETALTPTKHYELNIGCADPVSFGEFGKIALGIVEYVSHQYSNYDRLVDDLAFAGHKWDLFQYRLPSDVRSALASATRCDDETLTSPAAAASGPSEPSTIDDLALYMGLQNMASLDDYVAHAIVDNEPEKFGSRFSGFEAIQDPDY